MRRIILFLLMFSASAAYGEMYTWKDARGTVFYTNSLHEIPARYLKRARVLDVATGKKAGLATAQPASQGNPASLSGQASAQQVTATPASPAPAAAASVAIPPAAIPPAATPPAVSSPAVPVRSAADGARRGDRRQAREQRRRARSSMNEE